MINEVDGNLLCLYHVCPKSKDVLPSQSLITAFEPKPCLV